MLGGVDSGVDSAAEFLIGGAVYPLVIVIGSGGVHGLRHPLGTLCGLQRQQWDIVARDVPEAHVMGLEVLLRTEEHAVKEFDIHRVRYIGLVNSRPEKSLVRVYLWCHSPETWCMMYVKRRNQSL